MEVAISWCEPDISVESNRLFICFWPVLFSRNHLITIEKENKDRLLKCSGFLHSLFLFSNSLYGPEVQYVCRDDTARQAERQSAQSLTQTSDKPSSTCKWKASFVCAGGWGGGLNKLIVWVFLLCCSLYLDGWMTAGVAFLTQAQPHFYLIFPNGNFSIIIKVPTRIAWFFLVSYSKNNTIILNSQQPQCMHCIDVYCMYCMYILNVLHRVINYAVLCVLHWLFFHSADPFLTKL